MSRLVDDSGLQEKIKIDSAGIMGWHTGKGPDDRMKQAGKARAVAIAGHARQVTAADLREFDLVLAMDRENLAGLHELDEAGEYRDKIQLFCEFCERHAEEEVPDPYYGGADGFEKVLDLLEDGCEEILKEVRKRITA